jgi:3'-5' exoribonuclease
MKTLIEHLIISHHGQYDFGSPKLPMFPEALMLHYLDDLDSKMESMRALFAREAETENSWTNYSPSLGRPLLNSRKYLEKKDSDPDANSAVKSEPTDATVEATAEPTEPAAPEQDPTPIAAVVYSNKS